MITGPIPYKVGNSSSHISVVSEVALRGDGRPTGSEAVK